MPKRASLTAQAPVAPGRRTIPPLDPLRYGPSMGRPVRAKARVLTADLQVEPHSHAWGQLAFSATGVARITAGRSTFIVPPSRAVWIPPNVVHAVTVLEDADMRTVYLHQSAGEVGPNVPTAQQPVWRECRVLEVTALMRELVLELARVPAPGRDATGRFPPGEPTERERCLAALILDEMRQAKPVPLGVALPADKRLRALCEAVLNEPGRHTTLAGWAGEVGASPRTVARLFRDELQTSFVQWRQQVLLAKALSLSARKRPMSHIAAELGYASASAFTAMVTRSVGMPPSRFFALGQ